MFANLVDLSDAIDADQLVPSFQPIVELRTGQLTGFEVLARWQHPQHGLFLPSNFISLAEQNGLVPRVMQQVFSKAFRAARILPGPLVLSVNISPCQLRDATLPSQLRVIAEEAGFPMDRLDIEITESGIVDNLQLAQSIVGQLKSMGCRLSMDDFGTGYSSLRQLQGLPFDTLKVDRSFVSSMTDHRDSRKIAAVVIGLGRSLGMTTIAEGVETEDQANMLRLLGCEMAQGWFYGRPLPAGSLPELLAAAPRPPASSSIPSGRPNAVSCLEALPTHRLAQLQAIYDGAPVGLCFLDKNLRHVSLNRRLAEINGMPIAAHIGKTVKEVLPALFPLVEPYLLRALHGETITDIEVCHPPTEGSKPGPTMLLSYQPAFDEAGEVIGVSLAVTDITERKRAEEALRASEDHCRNMLELNPQIPWVLDSKGNAIGISSRWVELTGISKEETFTGKAADALHPDDRRIWREAVMEAVKNHGPIDVKLRVRSIDGGWKWMRSRGTPCFTSSGEVARWYGTLEAIDESVKDGESPHMCRHNCPNCQHPAASSPHCNSLRDFLQMSFSWMRAESVAKAGAF